MIRDSGLLFWATLYSVTRSGQSAKLGWRRHSVARASVCGRRTFPDLRLICG